MGEEYDRILLSLPSIVIHPATVLCFYLKEHINLTQDGHVLYKDGEIGDTLRNHLMFFCYCINKPPFDYFKMCTVLSHSFVPSYVYYSNDKFPWKHI